MRKYMMVALAIQAEGRGHVWGVHTCLQLQLYGILADGRLTGDKRRFWGFV